MANKIFAEWKRYNANTRDSNVGDCVKRGLSVAYSMDYDEVSRELNQIKRAIGADAYNESRVFNVFMKRRGDTWTTPERKDITVSEFCETHTSGIYCLLVGKKPGGSTHLAAVVDGNLYDSWDSQSWFIHKLSAVSRGKSDTLSFIIKI